jgi:hypothetical protein
LVTVVVDGKEEKKDLTKEGSGVKEEVAAWAKGLERGSIDPQQSPQEALQDLRVVSLQSSVNIVDANNRIA